MALIELLARTAYVPAYLSFCRRYPQQPDAPDKPRLDTKDLQKIVLALGIPAKWHARFRVLDLDMEMIAGWSWKIALVVQRYDTLEPMLSGDNGKFSIGTTLFDFLDRANVLRNCPIDLGPLVLRPDFDGNMRTMERMIPDLVAVFRLVKDAIREHWPAIDASLPNTPAPRTPI